MTLLFSALGYLYTHVLPFVLLLGILVFVHELGHYLVAIWCGVRVEVFSLGFGKKILSYKRGHTIYCISIVPLGGFVKMFGEQGSESVITDEDKKVSFSHKNPWQRIAIVLAGPMMNFLFAVGVFAVISQVGEQTRAPLIAGVTSKSAADQAGLKAGDRILQVNSQAVRSFDEFQKILNKNKGSDVQALIRDTNGTEKQVKLPVTSAANPNIFSLESQLGQVDGIEGLAFGTTLGVIPGSEAYKLGIRSGDEVISINNEKVKLWTELDSHLSSARQDLTIEVERPSLELDENDIPKTKTKLKFEIAQTDLQKFKDLAGFGLEQPQLYLGSVVKGSPADLGGIQPYDKIVAINSKPVSKWLDILETIKAYDGKEPLSLSIIRPGDETSDSSQLKSLEVVKKVTPKVTEQTTAFGATDKRYTLGIITLIGYAEPETVTVAADNPLQALVNGTIRTVDVSVMTFMSFVKLFEGQVSPKNLGGMVSIGKVAKDSFEVGPQAFFMTMGILSVSLFILNLMPIPVLDGGHLMFYLIELVKGSPLSLKKMEVAQQVGFVLLLGLMILAQFNDIVKFLFKS